jgi:hypothetical protein
MPMELTCSGATMQICRADLTGFQNIEPPCATPELCTAGLAGGACMAPACVAGAWQCAGRNLQQCPMSRVDWVTQVQCDSPDLCDETNMQCDECIPPLVECVDTVRRECDPTGHWMEVDCATTMQTCDPGPPPVCVGP